MSNKILRNTTNEHKLSRRSRTMRCDDLPHVWAIDQQCFSREWGRDDFVSRLASKHCCCRVTVQGEQVTGYVVTERRVDDLHILRIAVQPDAQRQGIGTCLLEQAKEAMSSAHILTAEVTGWDTTAQMFYWDCGLRHMFAVRSDNTCAMRGYYAMQYKKENAHGDKS